MALEIGLHQTPRNWQISGRAMDQRNCVFWTAFTIETTLAYNLGRPPSISEDHISVESPAVTSETLLAVQHIKHRQIQNIIISSVYAVGSKKRSFPVDERLKIIDDIQEKLDQWQEDLDADFDSVEGSGYPPR